MGRRKQRREGGRRRDEMRLLDSWVGSGRGEGRSSDSRRGRVRRMRRGQVEASLVRVRRARFSISRERERLPFFVSPPLVNPPSFSFSTACKDYIRYTRPTPSTHPTTDSDHDARGDGRKSERGMKNALETRITRDSRSDGEGREGTKDTGCRAERGEARSLGMHEGLRSVADSEANSMLTNSKCSTCLPLSFRSPHQSAFPLHSSLSLLLVLVPSPCTITSPPPSSTTQTQWVRSPVPSLPLGLGLEGD